MNSRRLLDLVIRRTGLGRLPVRVRAGIAQGASWTLYPWTSYWRGTFEPDIQAAIAGIGEMEGRSCWDVGAHFGIYSIGLARRVGPRGQVAAFEPNPQNFEHLKRHRDMNRLDWLLLFPNAVSDVTGRAKLLTYGETDSTTTHLPYEGETVDERAQPIEVQTVRLDDLVRAGAIRPPWLVKVDAEGHGHQVLRGMQETLSQHRPRLVIAFHSDTEVAGVTGNLDPYRYDRKVLDVVAGDSSLIGRTCFFTPRP